MAYILRQIDDIAIQHTSHGIGAKQVLLCGSETKTPLTQIARSSLLAGESVDEHVHPTMDEHYIVLGGEAVMTVDGRRLPLHCGSYLVVLAGSPHALTAKTDISFITIGVATD